jgi:hypothetical protein
MTTRIVLSLLLPASLGLAAGLGAQTPPAPPVRQIGAVTAVSHDSLSAVTTAVEVAGGRIYVNDIINHRVLLYDSTLGSATVVADSDPASPNAYGARPGTLMPFHHDSALFITPASLSMLVLSPAGQIARVMAMPPSGGGGIPALIGSIFGTPGFDTQGRLVYFSPIRMQMRGPPPSDGPFAMDPPDSAYVVRFNFATRTLDTAAVIHIPHSHTMLNRDDRGQMHIAITAFPPSTLDDWAVAADGRLAVVRGRDYHVDWLGSDGNWTSSPKMTFGWERLGDEQKAALIDSMATVMQANMDSLPARMQRADGGTGNAAGGARTETHQAAPGAGGGMVMVFSGPGGGGDGASGGGPPRSVQFNVPTVVKAAAAEVPDYRPAFGQGSVRADRDGNLWVRTTTIVDGRPVYDIVNSRGELTDRVQLPQFRTIAGFGNGVVLLGVRDANGVMHLERARIR